MRTKVFLISILLLMGSMLYAQGTSGNKIPLIGSAAPAFKAETTKGILNFPGDFGYSWKILFSHPQDFTPVCTSEFIQLAKMQDEFESLAVKIAIISTDTKERHVLWKKSVEEVLYKDSQSDSVKFPLIADENTGISKLYGMLHETSSTTKDVRGVFIISPDNIVEAVFFYPGYIGRNLDEIVRTVQALQTARASKLCTPANWEPGDDLIVPHYPYTTEEMISNPAIVNDYLCIGSYLWFRKRFLP